MIEKNLDLNRFKNFAPEPWRWGEDWKYQNEAWQGMKYADLRLYSNTGEILPIRIDHSEIEIDFDSVASDLDEPTRELIASAPDILNYARYLEKRLESAVKTIEKCSIFMDDVIKHVGKFPVQNYANMNEAFMMKSEFVEGEEQ